MKTQLESSNFGNGSDEENLENLRRSTRDWRKLVRTWRKLQEHGESRWEEPRES